MATYINHEANNLLVENDGYQYRRINGKWQMMGNSGKWFDCNIQDPNVERHVADYEYCLQPYSAEDGPTYPKGRKYSEDISAFIRRLQIKELRQTCKDLFAPLRFCDLRYDAHAQNIARFNREYSVARLTRPMPTNTRYKDY